MTLKNLAIATAAALSFAAVPMASANNAPDPLLTVVPGGCEEGGVNNDVQQNAGWTWDDGGKQTQFGGDAVYSVTGTINGTQVFGPLELEIELTRLDLETAMPTRMVYACPNLTSPDPAEESGSAGACQAQIADVEAAIAEATEEALVELNELGESDAFTITDSELVGVFVKAMDPGVAKGRGGRQNYEKTDVCGEEGEAE
ncbi:hypothetical protein [Thioalkalivibrio sp.]|uniref:hypothetical protein n=1 Tax=Thioalkalivibrio sp. TaxID=2093813 RepID=UPI0035646DE1